MEGRWGVVFRPEKQKSQAHGRAVCLHVCIFLCKLTGNHLWSAIEVSIEAPWFNLDDRIEIVKNEFQSTRSIERWLVEANLCGPGVDISSWNRRCILQAFERLEKYLKLKSHGCNKCSIICTNIHVMPGGDLGGTNEKG
jgi:hypothetical protein